MTDVAVPVQESDDGGKVRVQVQFVVQALESELAECRQQHLMLTALVNQQNAEIADLRGKLDDAPTDD